MGHCNSQGLNSFDSDLSSSNQTTSSQSSKTTNPFFQCKFCVRYFRSKSLLNEHTRKVHGIAGGASPGDGNSLNASKQSAFNATMDDGIEKVYSCQYCTYKSPRKARILKHQRMYHKDTLVGHSESAADAEPDTETMDADSDALSSEEHCEEAQDVLAEHNILDSMIKTQTRDGFSCEWCGFQTLQRQRLCDHMMKKHRNMVKIMVSLKKPKGDEGSAGSSKSASPLSPRSTPTSNLISNDLSGHEVSVTNVSSLKGKATSGLSSFQYSQITMKVPNSTGSSILSERSTFAASDISNSAVDLDSSVMNDSRSSSDGELCDMDDPNYTDPLSAEDSAKLLLSEEDNKLLETKGIPIRRHLNRFQCPFCSFLTTHRRSISRHIENIHLSGKTTLYKCDECPFLCTSSLKLTAHKQCHGGSSEWDTMDLTNESPDTQKEVSEPVNGGNGSSKMNGKKFTAVDEQQNSHHCALCNFSTATLKGLRVHQQHKHSYCDEIQGSGQEGSSNEQQDSETESYNSLNFVQKTQTSILGFSSRKHLIGKTARKSINDLPLDLSPVKKRTRIDEIANNLQSKISQSQQHEDIINLEEMEEEEDENENHIDDEQKERENSEIQSQRFTYNTQHLFIRKSGGAQAERGVGKRKRSLHPKLSSRAVPIQVTVSDDEDSHFSASIESKDIQDQSSQDSREAYQENVDYTEDPANLFYCKHCEYQNKSARSVSTHYQRMHPYIKFSFRYILDPEDQSAVFRCLECFIEYNSFNDLHQHYMDHHPEASNVLNFNQPDLVYTCRFCSYTSPNVRSLMPHYQRMHPSVKINNAMIFSSYVVDQPQKGTPESQTLREILNSGPKNFTTSVPRSSLSSPSLKNLCKTPDSSAESEAFRETLDGNVVVYDCDMCSFASPNMHSVLVHYQKKHPEQKASYFRIQKTMRVISVDRAQSSTNSNYNLSSTPKSSNVAMPMGMDEEVFYCKHCVYNNRSVVGVLVHYQKRHPEIKVTAKYIKHAPPTPGLMKLMEELQIAPPKQFMKQFSANSADGSNNLHPKGAAEKGEGEMLFFCQHCDYGNRTVKGVLIHYQKKHRDVKANADLVRRHTAVVRSQRERAQMNQTGSSTSTATSATEGEKPRPLRSLKCRHCVYTSPYVYALKKHLKKDHPTVKATAMTILHWAYQDGILEAGYHCEWCIYSHAEPNGLLMHYQRRHPEHNVDYAYMASKLWAGPDTSISRQMGNSETKHYQCRDCAFEACSIWDITNHYQAVHPWAIKGDESVLLDIIKGNPTAEKLLPQMAKGNISMSSPFNSHQTDEGTVETGRMASERQPLLAFSTTSLISNNPYQCTVCLSEYNSLHGLLTHYGKKHPGMKVKAADFAQEADINPSSVYKCRHCPYVNSRIHGVLTHYQKRHPLVKVTAEDFADDIEEVKELGTEGDERSKNQRQGYGAYRCKMCPYTHGTLEKLKIHYEKYHNQSASDMFTSAHVQSPANKEDSVAECSTTSVNEVSESSDFDLTLSEIAKGEKHAIFKCQLCKYFCSTRKGIARHYRIKHNNVRAQPEGKNNVFKCALCSYTNPIRKGLAAHYQKRHDIDAYYTHCLAASKTIGEKPSKVMVPLASEEDGPAMSEELREAVDRRKCSLCSFQAFSRKSIVSHYIKRHPGVFPKRQHSSKLGRYFTVIYPKETEKSTTIEDIELVEVKSEAEQENDMEWLQFKCMKCFKLSFSSADLLVNHYNDCHGKELKRDFVTIPSPAEDDTELYQCVHCEIKFLTLPDLSTHLTDHNEEFQKKATRQERRKQLQSKMKTAEPNEAKPENKSDGQADKAPIGYRCNFCVEMHPTLRAICNHLRKHVQYGEVKEGHVKEAANMPVAVDVNSVANGNEEEVLNVNTVATHVNPEPEDGVGTVMEDGVSMATVGGAGSMVTAGGAVPMATAEAISPTLEREKEHEVPGHPCGHCDRVFMSMQGLRSHERSHSAVALINREHKYSCQYCQFQSPFRHNLDRHVQSHHGHHKPFRCKLCPFKSAYLSRLKNHLHKSHAGENTYKCISCSFSTMTISQLKEHSLRDHGENLTLPKLRAGTALRTTRPNPSPTMDSQQTELDPETNESLMYLEPADVQQQLNHYQLASRTRPPIVSSSPAIDSSGSTQDSSVPAPSLTLDSSGSAPLLTCEFCEFSSGYMQSLRRHYRDRHGGKKLFKCKDCSFFTCNKSTFTMHVEAGHNSTPDEGPKDLRCPFCLYHTKYKSHMIDHIILHREERVVPLEVSRSKLSRYLEGLVFRCHKCTFTCSSDESLQQHVHKHEELKPYQCQLCYYDTKHRQQLEKHLRDEHKVIRNFELMGRVNLEQLEALQDKMSLSSAEEEEEDTQEVPATKDEEEERAVDVEEEEEGAVNKEQEEPAAVEEEEEEEEEQVAVEEEDDDEEEMVEETAETPEEKQEEEARRQEAAGIPMVSPSSSSSVSVSSAVMFSGSEKRIPCEFCGRTFSLSSEWERHVLRHGMTFNSSRTDTSPAPSIGTAAPLTIGLVPVSDAGLDLSMNNTTLAEREFKPVQIYTEPHETKNSDL
ncbi:zinc finger protein 462 isoform X2 [Hoplias malabaricus]|uniref:zinc finger protein 462 isoform X2 n=1 Tax=Hoplias malabaricus TaxID=27720 RepID=UPI0034631634